MTSRNLAASHPNGEMANEADLWVAQGTLEWTSRLMGYLMA
jgi:hypothetical protein